ncbi:MAG: DUF2269 family protein [Actinomycetota bacterium]
MTRYETLLLIHVVMAVVWVGGGAALNILAVRVVSAGSPERTVGFARDVEWVGTRVFAPASLLALGSGVWAASEGDWSFGDPWISMGFAGWAFSFLVGMLFIGPQSGRVSRVVAAEGPSSPAAQAGIRRILLVSRVELLVLLVVIWAMVAKPGL